MTKAFHTYFNFPVVIISTALILLFTGCYRMPSDDECSLVPTTNNPDITRDHGGGLVPSGSF